MPNRTIYIRKEDLEKWDGLDDRPGFIHSALNLELRAPTKDEVEQVENDPFHKGSPPLSEIAVGELDTKGKVVGMFRNDRTPIPKSFSARKKK